MSLNQAIRQNKNTNLTAMYVSASYEEWEIDIRMASSTLKKSCLADVKTTDKS